MTSRRLVLIATPASLVDLLGIDPLLRGSMTVRLQTVAGTVLYGSAASQDMAVPVSPDAAEDLVLANGADLHLKGPGTVNVLVH
jgi:hypothetical protein